MKRFIKGFIKKRPYIRRFIWLRDQLAKEFEEVRAERDLLRAERNLLWMPPGHYYSPIPSMDDVRARERELFEDVPRTISGVDLNEQRQLELLGEFAGYYREMPFGEDKKDKHRYFLNNQFYSYTDGIILYCMLRHLKPKRIIEAGSGHSSCVILDTNELFLGGKASCTFVDPYPERLLSLLEDGDREKIEIIEKPLQEIDPGKFAELSSGDVLVIDSTHVSKIGSDVNHIFFQILPMLQSGVHIHFHDIFYPFEYPKEWVYEGRAWNEAYLLRAFLQHNDTFKIEFFTSYLRRVHGERLGELMPLCLEHPGGSIWLRKLSG